MKRIGAVRQLRETLANVIAEQLTHEDDLLTAVPGLTLYRRHAPVVADCQVFEPALAIVAQGAKVMEVGQQSLAYGEATWLLTPVHVPAMSRVTRASVQRPYLACALLLDLGLAREMLHECAPASGKNAAQGLAVTTGAVSLELLDAMTRLIRLNQSQKDIPMLGGLVQQEILYRVIMSDAGHMLRQFVTAGSQSQRVARAVDWLRENFSKPLSLEELAQHARMGVSTLHHHFRKLTGSSPLQFQKQLRLVHARRLMLTEDTDASMAAYMSGYESATQFNREYRRQFGHPPGRDVRRL